jgi:hypothetical protein
VKVFSTRIKNQYNFLKKIPHCGKFGGATGNLNAHYVSYPNINWHSFSKKFLNKRGDAVLFISCDVKPKCINSTYFFKPILSNSSLMKYSTALTS